MRCWRTGCRGDTPGHKEHEEVRLCEEKRCQVPFLGRPGLRWALCRSNCATVLAIHPLDSAHTGILPLLPPPKKTVPGTCEKLVLPISALRIFNTLNC